MRRMCAFLRIKGVPFMGCISTQKWMWRLYASGAVCGVTQRRFANKNYTAGTQKGAYTKAVTPELLSFLVWFH